MKKVCVFMIAMMLAIMGFSQTIISTFPWNDDFENGITNWTITNSSSVAAANGWSLVSSGTNPSCSPNSGTGMLRFKSYSISSNGWSMAVSPAMSFSSQMEVSYYIYKSTSFASSADRVVVYVSSTTDTTGATRLGSELRYRSNPGWTKITYTVPATVTGTQYVIIKGVSSYGENFFIDDVKVRPVPTCPDPTGLAVSNPTAHSIDLAWTSSATNFTLQYKSLSDTGWNEVNGISTPSYTLTGLTAGTQYQFKVKAICSATDQSDWTAAVSGVTNCEAITDFPWTEGFEGSWLSASGLS